MTPKKIKTEEVEKGDYKVFAKKAKDFYDIMLTAKKADNWTATGLNSVHCVISSCDAVLTFHLGIRSISDDHGDMKGTSGPSARNSLAIVAINWRPQFFFS